MGTEISEELVQIREAISKAQALHHKRVVRVLVGSAVSVGLLGVLYLLFVFIPVNRLVDDIMRLLVP